MLRHLQEHLHSTTIHGLGHLSGERKKYVKVFWLLTVLASLCICTYKVHAAYKRYAAGEVATTIEAESLKFEFPDVYICNESPISGSYSVSLNAEDGKLLQRYRELVKTGTPARNRGTDFYIAQLVNSLPFQFLSDKLGHQLQQMFFLAAINKLSKAVAIRAFHHPFYINCMTFNFSQEDREKLRHPSVDLQVYLFLDPLLPSVCHQNSTEPDQINSMLLSEKKTVLPYAWDFNWGTAPIQRATGFKVFLTPRGHYPSEWDTQLQIAPGMQYNVRVKMQDVSHSAADFAGQCIGSGQQDLVDFVDPFSNTRSAYQYSQSVCLYRQLANYMLKKFNCSLHRLPLLWQYRDLPNCYNVTAATSAAPLSFMDRNELYQLYSDMLFIYIANFTERAREECQKEMPCLQRQYSYEYSFSNWPDLHIMREYLLPWYKIIRNNVNYDHSRCAYMPGNCTPGWDFLVFNASDQQARGSIAHLIVSSYEAKSSRIQLSLAYGFNSLIADIGGLLGLFLGMSLLSVMELLELVHNCLLGVIADQHRVGKQPTEAVPSTDAEENKPNSNADL